MADACDCLAAQTVSRMRKSPGFLKALTDGNRDDMPDLMQDLQTEPDGRSLQTVCTEGAIQRAGGTEAASVPPDPSKPLPGLRGAMRDRFIAESSMSCNAAFEDQVKDGKLEAQQLVDYCGCMAEGVAAQITAADLAEGMKNQGRSSAMDAASLKMQRACSGRFIR